mmetsp:Transcript_28849/g.40205  ORF Transcript_28849/g.40205 Transcript_28849/m.40205 type:complete len:284 (+) Transcript_28849:93-944(+)
MIYFTAALLATAAVASPAVPARRAGLRSATRSVLNRLPHGKAPASQPSKTAVKADIRSLQTGSTGPVEYFDPFNLAASTDDSQLKRWREAELTHGRVAMLSALGFLVAESFHPLFGGDVTGPAIDHFQQIDDKYPGFWKALLFSISLFESYRSTYGWSDPTKGGNAFTLRDDYVPGDLKFDPLNVLAGKSEAEITELKNKELNNGRLAMISLAGIIVQELINHETIIDTWREILDSEEKATIGLTDKDFQENIQKIDPNYLKTPTPDYDKEKVGELIKELPKL